MPSNKQLFVALTSKRDVHITMPRTKSGKIDKRFKSAQIIKKYGTRDRRTTKTSTFKLK